MIPDKEIRIGMNVGYKGQIITLTRKLLFSPGFDINELEPILLTKDMAYELGFIDFPYNNKNKWFLYDDFLLQIMEYTQEEFQPILESEGGYGPMIVDDHDGMIRYPDGHCALGIYFPESKTVLLTEEDIANLEDPGDLDIILSTKEPNATIPESLSFYSHKIKYVHHLQNIIYDVSKKELSLYASTLSFILGLGLKP